MMEALGQKHPQVGLRLDSHWGVEFAFGAPTVRLRAIRDPPGGEGLCPSLATFSFDAASTTFTK